jgi:hypothetical protein
LPLYLFQTEARFPDDFFPFRHIAFNQRCKFLRAAGGGLDTDRDKTLPYRFVADGFDELAVERIGAWNYFSR